MEVRKNTWLIAKNIRHIFKIQGTYFKISALYFLTCQVSEQQQLIKEVRKSCICRIISVLRKMPGLGFGARGFGLSAFRDCGAISGFFDFFSEFQAELNALFGCFE